jgi:hypothetical protein
VACRDPAVAPEWVRKRAIGKEADGESVGDAVRASEGTAGGWSGGRAGGDGEVVPATAASVVVLKESVAMGWLAGDDQGMALAGICGARAIDE